MTDQDTWVTTSERVHPGEEGGRLGVGGSGPTIVEAGPGGTS